MKVLFPHFAHIVIPPYEDWKFFYDELGQSVTGSNDEDRLLIQMWSNQSGDWGVCITYLPIDSYPSQKIFQFNKTTNLTIAGTAVSVWITQAIELFDGRKRNTLDNHYKIARFVGGIG